jgi:glutamate N-acetyltransferase/amino-acid N-acetyltransferase
VAAVGYSEAFVDPSLLSLSLSSGKGPPIDLLQNGLICTAAADKFQEDALAAIMKSAEVSIQIDLGVGVASATAWGCDLTDDYVRINAQYTT